MNDQVFSSRQQDVIRGVSLGKALKTIASDCGISYRTVEKHLALVRKKLGVSSNAGIIHWAIGSGLVRLGEALPKAQQPTSARASTWVPPPGPEGYQPGIH
jgi:DNA-binding CsgD family transcriptional regulator